MVYAIPSPSIAAAAAVAAAIPFGRDLTPRSQVLLINFETRKHIRTRKKEKLKEAESANFSLFPRLFARSLGRRSFNAGQ